MQVEANLSSISAIPVASHGGHGHHPDLRLFGVKIFLISESALFLSLFAAYLTFKFVSPVWPPEGTPERELLVPGINSVILIASSFVIHQAENALRDNKIQEVQKWFGLTALMGMIFLAGQVYEYVHLEFGLTANLYASSFYVLTGFHGLHVLVGVLLILGVLWRSQIPGHYSSQQHFGIAAAELYWHFVDVVWIILFFLLYIL